MDKHFTQWMNEGRDENRRRFTKRILLNDGNSLSIQASDGHYCSPRIDLDDYSEYNQFEIGFPSCHIDEISDRQDGSGDHTESVFGYVSKEVIEALIEARGGVKGFASQD